MIRAKRIWQTVTAMECREEVDTDTVIVTRCAALRYVICTLYIHVCMYIPAALALFGGYSDDTNEATKRSSRVAYIDLKCLEYVCFRLLKCRRTLTGDECCRWNNTEIEEIPIIRFVKSIIRSNTWSVSNGVGGVGNWSQNCGVAVEGVGGPEIELLLLLLLLLVLPVH